MPKKGKKRRGRRKKAPLFWAEPQDMAPFFGLKARDLVKTPMALVATVLGVKYATKQRGETGTGTLWVEYNRGFKSPLEKDVTGYTRCPEADHLWRDMKELAKKVEEEDQVRAIIDDANEIYVAELVADWEKKNQKKKKKKKKKPLPNPIKGSPAAQPTATPTVAKATRQKK